MLLDSHGQPLAMPEGPAKPPRIPTYEEMKGLLDVVTGNTIVFLRSRGVTPGTIQSVGTILSQMKFDVTQQSAADVEDIISKAATKQLDALKEELIRASIAVNTPEPEKVNVG